MNYRNIVIIIGLLLPFMNRAMAQTQFVGWFASFNTFKINTRFSIHGEVQLRSTDQLDHLQTLLLRTGLNYHVNSRLMITAGYGYIPNRRVLAGIAGYAPESRIFEQLQYTHPLALGQSKGTLAHRLRIEQRFIPKSYIQNNEFKNDGNVYSNRVRYFIRNIMPLHAWSDKGTAPFLALQNEVFVNVGDKSGVNGEFFDQNRAYIAFGYRFHKKFDAELGYMNQYVNGRDKAFTNNHIVQVATYVRL
ncbi:MAG: DUF2490 domain-containing protein [Niastella sp.]|nr:DUF2490 domain-containing protein [Niastella sp.]